MPTLIQPTAQIESAHASTIQKMTSDKIFKGHRRSMHLLEAREASSPTAVENNYTRYHIDSIDFMLTAQQQ